MGRTKLKSIKFNNNKNNYEIVQSLMLTQGKNKSNPTLRQFIYSIVNRILTRLSAVVLHEF